MKIYTLLHLAQQLTLSNFIFSRGKGFEGWNILFVTMKLLQQQISNETHNH